MARWGWLRSRGRRRGAAATALNGPPPSVKLLRRGALVLPVLLRGGTQVLSEVAARAAFGLHPCFRAEAWAQLAMVHWRCGFPVPSHGVLTPRGWHGVVQLLHLVRVVGRPARFPLLEGCRRNTHGCLRCRLAHGGKQHRECRARGELRRLRLQCCGECRCSWRPRRSELAPGCWLLRPLRLRLPCEPRRGRAARLEHGDRQAERIRPLGGVR